MNKTEFLEQLREALTTDLSSRAVEENIRYYSQYISDEERKGRTEQEILNELGDPWLIAKTLIDTGAGASDDSEGYRTQETDDTYQEYGRQTGYDRMKVYHVDTWWKKALITIGMIAIIGAILWLVTGILSFLAPILIPVLIIAIIINLLKR